MKIAYDAKRLFNNFTGLGNYSRTLLDGMLEFYPDNEYLLYTPKVRENALTQPYLSKPHVSLELPSHRLLGSLWRTFGIARTLPDLQVELYHGLSHELPRRIDKSGAATVLTVHDVAFHTFPEMYHRQDRFIYDRKMRHACRTADRIVAISECTKRDVMHYYGVEEERIEVVYQPVQRLFYRCPSAEEAQARIAEAFPTLPQDFLLYVGSINRRKNLLTIVRALELIPTEERLPLVVVGSGREYKDEVQTYVERHSLERWVLFFSRVESNFDLQALYRRARLFIYPSFYEGFGLPVVEAQLSGCPVITSALSCLPEAASPQTVLINPADEKELSQNIRRLLADRSLCDAMSRSGMEFAQKKFDPERLTRQMMNLYERTLREKK